MENSLVSVIMPVYMAEEYVENSIMSVINQSYTNVEIICVDDASTDNSYAICEKLCGKYDNIRLYRNIDESGQPAKKNLGQERTRNLGIEKARGKYFLFLDADDTLQEDTIEMVVKKAEETKADVVMFTFSQIIEGEDIPVLADVESGFYHIDELAKLLLKEIPWSVISCIGSKLYRTEMIKAANVHFDIKYKYNEDCAFCLEVLKNVKNVFYVNEPFYKYLIRNSLSVMSSYRDNMFVTNKRVVELCKSLFISTGCFNDKRNDYYKRMFNLIMDSLINEIRFGNKISFRKTIEIICEDDDFENVCKCIEENYSFTKWQRFFCLILKRKMYGCIYYILQLRRLLKSKKKITKIRIKIITCVLRKAYSFGKEKNVVYMFHDISEKTTDISRFVSNYQSFEKFIEMKSSIGEAVSIREVANGKKQNAFAITFDDGYMGVFQYAYPILKKYRVPFTVFLTVDYIGRDNYMSKKEIMILNEDELCTIGAHSMSHEMLRYSPDSMKEIECSKRVLEELIEKPVAYFAYPYGSVYACSLKNIKQADRAGYEYAFSSIEGYQNFFARRNKFFMPRMDGDIEVKKIEDTEG